MPPEAISPSRTYFPKIWGNTRPGYRTALLGIWLGTACTEPPPEVTTRAIRARWLPLCQPENASARDVGATGELDVDALGDFDPSTDTHAVVALRGPESTLGIPDSTRAVVLDADTGFGLFRGTSTVPAAGDIPVALWPAQKTCLLHDRDPSLLADVDGVAVGYAANESLLLFVGGPTNPSDAFVADLASGSVEPVSPSAGPRVARVGATVTPFGSELLVAGGSDPDDRSAIGSADVFDPSHRSFELGARSGPKIDLERPRAEHAAVVLASGETLLVGGRDASGSPLRRLEAISPETATYRISRLATLTAARAKPLAIRLTDDRILVAGGVGADGAPVDLLEWLSPDASRVVQQSSLRTDLGAPVTEDRAFVAMPGGSALSVGGCRAPESSSGSPCNVPCPFVDAAGNSTNGCASSDVYWITPDGVPDLVADALDAATWPPLLVAGAEGRPWLVARSASGRGLLRFNPWTGHFDVAEDAPPPPLDGFPSDGSAFEARLFSVDPGLFVWFAANRNAAGLDPPRLIGFRHDTRGPYAPAVTPLLLADQDGVALDRMNPGGFPGLDPDGSVDLDGSGITLVVTDTTYLDFGVSIDVVTGQPPVLVLGSDTYGGASCPWPTPIRDGRYAVKARRIGDVVTLAIGSKTTTCPGPSGRVSIWLRSSGPAVSIRTIAVTRSP